MSNEDKITGIPVSTDTVGWHGNGFTLSVDVILAGLVKFHGYRLKKSKVVKYFRLRSENTERL